MIAAASRIAGPSWAQPPPAPSTEASAIRSGGSETGSPSGSNLRFAPLEEEATVGHPERDLAALEEALLGGDADAAQLLARLQQRLDQATQLRVEFGHRWRS
ncbi:MAG TPA: hypothetical protein VGO36_07940 [Solirubrobacterales bacterium]|nr:hypothetical protein [Solirubrobacterales bacterium]